MTLNTTRSSWGNVHRRKHEASIPSCLRSPSPRIVEFSPNFRTPAWSAQPAYESHACENIGTRRVRAAFCALSRCVTPDVLRAKLDSGLLTLTDHTGKSKIAAASFGTSPARGLGYDSLRGKNDRSQVLLLGSRFCLTSDNPGCVNKICANSIRPSPSSHVSQQSFNAHLEKPFPQGS